MHMMDQVTFREVESNGLPKDGCFVELQESPKRKHSRYAPGELWTPEGEPVELVEAPERSHSRYAPGELWIPEGESLDIPENSEKIDTVRHRRYAPGQCWTKFFQDIFTSDPYCETSEVTGIDRNEELFSSDPYCETSEVTGINRNEELFRPDFCKLCNVVLLEPIAYAHYGGESHKKRFAKYAYEQMIAEGLSSIKLNDHATVTDSEEGKSVKPKEGKFYCEICNIKNMTQLVYDKHIKSKDHKKEQKWRAYQNKLGEMY